LRSKRQQRRFFITLLAPAFVLYTVFVFIPGVRALVYSLQKWDGLGDPAWAGIDNFRALFADDLFVSALRHNILLGVVGGSITLGLALFFASLLHRKIRGAGIFRVAFFFPNIIAAVAVAILWMLLYSTTDFGMVNALLGVIQSFYDTVTGSVAAVSSLAYLGSSNGGVVKGIAGEIWLSAARADGMREALPFAFTDSKYLIYSLIPMMVWTATGFYMVLFVAAMENIPEEYYEAAKLDGATPATWRDAHVELHAPGVGHFNAGDSVPVQRRLARELAGDEEVRELLRNLALPGVAPEV